MEHKHLQHPDVHMPASQWSEDQILHVVAAYSNPFRWRTRRELANDFRRHMRQLPNVELHLVELAYGDRPFDIADPELYPTDIALRTRHELFHKENLLQVGVSRLPADWKYAAIVDADFHFTRHDIALETIHQLQHYDWVQMFSSYVNVTGETRPGEGHRPIHHANDGFAFRFVNNGNRMPEGYNGGWAEPSGSGGDTPSGPLPWVGAPGGAWAFRREAFDAVGGLLDRCILGSGDWFMAWGLAGQMVNVELEKKLGKKVHKYRPDYLEYIRAWQHRAKEAFHGNIGYVDSFAVHHFHGSMKNRGYSTRDNILIENHFSPVHDVHPDWQGVLQLTKHKPRLRDDIRRYFLSRSEDAG